MKIDIHNIITSKPITLTSRPTYKRDPIDIPVGTNIRMIMKKSVGSNGIKTWFTAFIIQNGIVFSKVVYRNEKGIETDQGWSSVILMCPKCKGALVFISQYGSPGYGDHYECQDCSHKQVVLRGTEFVDHVPELSIHDVI